MRSFTHNLRTSGGPYYVYYMAKGVSRLHPAALLGTLHLCGWSNVDYLGVPVETAGVCTLHYISRCGGIKRGIGCWATYICHKGQGIVPW